MKRFLFSIFCIWLCTPQFGISQEAEVGDKKSNLSFQLNLDSASKVLGYLLAASEFCDIKLENNGVKRWMTAHVRASDVQFVEFLAFYHATYRIKLKDQAVEMKVGICKETQKLIAERGMNTEAYPFGDKAVEAYAALFAAALDTCNLDVTDNSWARFAKEYGGPHFEFDDENIKNKMLEQKPHIESASPSRRAAHCFQISRGMEAFGLLQPKAAVDKTENDAEATAETFTEEAAIQLGRAIGISTFCGFDFMYGLPALMISRVPVQSQRKLLTETMLQSAAKQGEIVVGMPKSKRSGFCMEVKPTLQEAGLVLKGN